MSGIPVWVMDNIQNYEFDKTQCLFISDEKFRELGSYSTNNGDIIISRAGTVGKMCVIEDVSSESIISTNLIKATFDNKRINPYYFVLLMKYFSKKIGRLRTGSDTGFTHMNTSVLNGLEIPCPPIEIQNSFVEAFSTKRKIKFITQNSDCNLFNSLLQKAFKGELLS
jgi:type I restriction enzyme S subunit